MVDKLWGNKTALYIPQEDHNPDLYLKNLSLSRMADVSDLTGILLHRQSTETSVHVSWFRVTLDALIFSTNSLECMKFHLLVSQGNMWDCMFSALIEIASAEQKSNCQTNFFSPHPELHLALFYAFGVSHDRFVIRSYTTWQISQFIRLEFLMLTRVWVWA